MSANVTLVRMHEVRDVRQIIHAATEIADDHERDPIQWVAIFNKACELLAARVPLIQQGTPLTLPENLHSLRV